jgi:peptidoglycan/LPS O-acetylase OafA/YrhL
MNLRGHYPIQFSKLSTYRAELYGFSAIWILIFHLLIWKVFPQGAISSVALRHFILLGNTGVDIFLILSGISLYFAMQKRRTMSDYFVRRLSRLMPTLIISYIGIWTYQLINSGNIPQYLIRLSGLALWFEGNKTGTWYVSAILVFYVLYPYIYSWLFDNNRGFIFPRWCLLLILSLVIFWAMHKLNFEYFKLVEIALGRIPSFLIGCLLGKWVYENKTIKYVWKLPIVIVAIAFYILRNPEAQWHWWTRLLYPVGGLLILLAFTVLLSTVDNHRKKPEKKDNHPIRVFLRKTGDLSLELYLGSVAILQVCSVTGVPFLTFAPSDNVWVRAGISVAFIAATYVVAFLAHACIDALGSLKQRHARKLA